MPYEIPSRDELLGLAVTTRRAMVAITADGASSPRTISAANETALRGLVRVPFTTKRWRIRARNAKYDGTVYSLGSPPTITNFYLGDPRFPSSGTWDGIFKTAPTKMLSAFALNADGSDTVAPSPDTWVEDPAKQLVGGRAYGFSLGISTPVTGVQVAQSSYAGIGYGLGGGGGAGISSDAEVGRADGPKGYTILDSAVTVGQTLLDIRFEYEVETNPTNPRRVGLIIGDSISRGSADAPDTSAYSHEAWPGLAGTKNGFLPINAAIGGTTVGQWGGYDEVQTVTITGTPTGGTFTLSFGGQTTAPIAYNADAATVQAALAALSSIGAGNVTVSGGPLPGTAVTVAFIGSLGGQDVAQMTASGAGLTGGTTPAVVVATIQAGNTLDVATAWIWERFDINGIVPDFAVVYLGTNSLNQSPPTPLAAIQDGLHRIVDKLFAIGVAKVYMVTIIPRAFVDGTPAGTTKESDRLALNTWIRDMPLGVIPIDFDYVMKNPADAHVIEPGYVSGTGGTTHPNRAGQARMAQVAIIQ